MKQNILRTPKDDKYLMAPVLLALTDLGFASKLGLGFGKCCVRLKGLSVIRALGHCSGIF